MPIKFNGTTITKVIKDGITLDVVKFGNTIVHQNRKLIIHYIGYGDAASSTYPIYIRSNTIGSVAVYGASMNKEIYIPNGERVTIDASSFINYRTDIPRVSHEFVVEDNNRYSIQSTDKYKLTFTMDKDITFNSYYDDYDEITYMGLLSAWKEDYGYWWTSKRIHMVLPNGTMLTNPAWS